MIHNPSIGGHYAIHVDDLEAVKARLRAAGGCRSPRPANSPTGASGIFISPIRRAILVEVNSPV